MIETIAIVWMVGAFSGLLVVAFILGLRKARSARCVEDASEWVTVQHPLNSDQDILRVRVFKPGSKQAAATMNAVAEKMATYDTTNYAMVAEAERSLAIGYTADWRDVIENGKELPCNAANKRAVFTTYPWFSKAVVDAADALRDDSWGSCDG